jgi:hypothetical protein
MIARVAICRDTVDSDDGARTARHAKALRVRIQDRGIAVFASLTDQRGFIASLPPVERKRWTALMSSERKLVYVLPHHHAGSIHEHETMQELRASYRDEVDVIVCGRDHALRLGIPESLLLEEDEQPAIGALPDVHCARALGPDEQEGKSHRLVPAGTSREEVWTRYFQSAASLCSDILIVDRFAYDQASKGRFSGFRWMIDELLSTRRSEEPIRLEIVVQQRKSDLTVEAQLADAIVQLGVKDPPKAFRSVTVHLAATGYGVRNLHDRFLRFDGRVVCSTTGVSVLNTPHVRQQASVYLGDFTDSDTVWKDLRQSSVLTARWRSRYQMWVGAEDEILFAEEDAA